MENIDELHCQAIQALSDMELDKALELYNQLINKSPNYVREYYTGKSCALRKRGDYDTAIATLTDAIAIEPNMEDLYLLRSELFEETGDVDHALEDCNKAILLYPPFIEAYVNRGCIFANEGNFRRAVLDFDVAIALRQKNAATHVLRAKANFALMETGLAIADLDWAIRLKPTYPEAYMLRGEIKLLELNDASDAAMDFMAAASLGLAVPDEYIEEITKKTGRSWNF